MQAAVKYGWTLLDGVSLGSKWTITAMYKLGIG